MNEREPQGPPAHVINEWIRQCSCCPICHTDWIPCGGVMAGGLCDMHCDCDDDECDTQEA